ncbi:MAG: 2-amino-4-hydroxy-6-hydroxymethyldihydropteridine diphosphokinase [Marinovum sp.]|nr:2-amino-4-hydroxy-6-hydroxymethyldihydropteridine diphosphokinase [Marinovum sp.]
MDSAEKNQKLPPATALIALGSNADSPAGTRSEILRESLIALTHHGVTLRSVSRFFATPAFPPGAGPDYVNAAAELLYDSNATALLAILHDIEASFGRARDQRWGQRTLDLDLLDFARQVHPDVATYSQWQAAPPEVQQSQAPEQLILPHPRIQDRGFVLVPLCDIAPNWRHPVLGATAKELMNALPQASCDEVKAL